ncbi:MAG: threonine/serine dehydratase [Anaerotardibacter sp.]
MTFRINEIQDAAKRIASHIITTPLVRLEKLDSYLGCEVYAKLECMQKAGAFKLRGAMNAVLSLSEESLAKGIVTCSTGNHGRACAYAGKMLGIPVTVVVPFGAPEIKVENIKKLDAEIVQCQAVERFDVAASISKTTGKTFIPPYDDYDVMAGQGTAGLEIVDQLPEVDGVVIPTSGGGLLSGVCCAVKSSRSSIKTYGAEPAVMARYGASLACGEPVELPQAQTIADALLSNHPGQKCFEVAKEYVDEVVPVSDEELLQGWKLLLTEGSVFAEPSACIGIAAALAGKLPVSPGEKICFLISGGNCSVEQLGILSGVEV